MWAFFVGIATITFLFGVQSVQPDIQASLADKPEPKKEVRRLAFASQKNLNRSPEAYRA
jgi:hypothetical protein